MDSQKARDVLIDALIDQNIEGQTDRIEDLLRHGFRGYVNMLDIELVYEAEATCLRFPKVQAAIKYLRKLYEE